MTINMKNKQLILLVTIFILGTLLRFTHLNWDSYQALHPDERNIAWAVTRIRFFDQLNPKFFAYGGLPIYIYRALAEIAAQATGNPLWVENWGHINVLGRLVSATLSSASILLIFAVGSLYLGVNVGLLSAFLLAFSPWAVREAHFDTTETMLVFFILLLLKISYRFFKTQNYKKIVSISAFSGVVWGLSLGAKTTSALFAVIPFSALWLSNFHEILRKKILFEKFVGSLVIGLTALGFFFLTSPYTVLDWGAFYDSMRYETGVALGSFSVPYTLQFVGTKPYLYQFTTMIWQAGPVAVVGTIGLIILAAIVVISLVIETGKRFLVKISFRGWGGRLLRLKRITELTTLLSFPLIYGVWAGGWYAKFSRYNVPFLPFVALGAGWILIIFAKRFRLTGFALIALTAFASLFWTLANWTIYLRPETRLSASAWMYDNIRADTSIFTEHWNDGLPLTIPGKKETFFNRDQLTVYDTDNPAKLEYYAENLPRGQYIILSTRRMWATMPRLSKLYPLTSRFYENLQNGQLGYQEVATFTSYPSLFGLTINDDSAEESVQVFDHPTVRIFKNVSHISSTQVRSILENN